LQGIHVMGTDVAIPAGVLCAQAAYNAALVWKA